MFCPQCGAENEKDKSYCRRCGQSLAVVARLLDAEDESVRPKLTTSPQPPLLTEQNTLELKREDRKQL